MVMIRPIESAHDRPERQDHADENQAEVKLQAGGHGGQHLFGMAGQLDPGDRNQPDLLGEYQTGDYRQQDINEAEGQTDDAADGKNPPFPALFLLFSRLGQGHGAERCDRGHGKRQFFHIRSDPIEGITQTEMIDSLDDLRADQQQDRDQPVSVEESSLHHRDANPGRVPPRTE